MMATFDAYEITTEKSARPALLAPLAQAWAGLVRRYQERRTLHKLYQLDAHILRDMGFDPAEIYSAYEGQIGETYGHRNRGL